MRSLKYVRDTTLEAFFSVLNSGLITELQIMVYEYIYSHPDCSQKECSVALGAGATYDGVYTTRFSELERQLAIEVTGKKICRFTKRSVNTYRITGVVASKAPVPVLSFEEEPSFHYPLTTENQVTLVVIMLETLGIPYHRDYDKFGRLVEIFVFRKL